MQLQPGILSALLYKYQKIKISTNSTHTNKFRKGLIKENMISDLNFYSRDELVIFAIIEFIKMLKSKIYLHLSFT